MPKVSIDGFSIDVPDGTTILQASRLLALAGTMPDANVPPAMCLLQ
jgi:hypothetical protein